MSKVTYEEALHSLEMTRQHAVYGQAMEKEYNSSFIRNINKVEQFIEQHRPPTFDEVVMAWESLGYEATISVDLSMIFLEGYGKNPLYVSLRNGLESNDDIYFDVTAEMLSVINLSIRYLQAKEKENE